MATLLTPVGRSKGSGSLRGSWGCLRGIPFFRYVFNKPWSGFEYLLYTVSPIGMFFKEQEQLHIGNFCPFALPLAKQV
jgi:hypothetical protein